MLDCREFLDGIPDVRLASEFKSLGITKFHSLHVEHCRGSFGVVLECSHWGTVAFSGDCRPCRKFLNFKADILIHEAPFEDDLQVRPRKVALRAFYFISMITLRS